MKLYQNFLVFFLVLVSTFNLNAQNIAITDDNNYNPDGSAMLDVKSSTKGILIPRLTTVARTSITTPATGLMVYDTDFDEFFYYNGTSWINLFSNNSGQNLSGNTSLFAIVNAAGDTVFAVYPEGVVINIGDGIAKGSRGGFAVGGLTSGKLGGAVNYLTINRDSTRIYVDTVTIGKGARGGFAVGGLTSGKAPGPTYLTVSDDSVRIYVVDPGVKGNRGGFAVGGLTSGKVAPTNFMKLTPNNYFIGHESGIHTTGLYNTFFGYHTGYTNSTGHNNIFMGYKSGYSNVSGWNNLFIGNSSGYSNVSGEENSFIGLNSGYKNTTGRYNVFIGSKTGYLNLTGFENVYIGFYSGQASTGSGNVFMGSWSGQANTSGFYNTFIGMHSGYYNTTGIGNTYLGYSTGGIGNYNSALGYLTGVLNDGTGNLFLGYQAARYDTLGDYNTFLGYKAGLNIKNGSSNVYIGANAGSNAHGNNQLYIESEAGTDSTQSLIWGDFSANKLALNAKVGIGTTTPKSALQVNGGIQIANDSDAASADKVGTIRYRADSNNSWVEICMQTGASTYTWVLIKSYTW